MKIAAILDFEFNTTFCAIMQLSGCYIFMLPHLSFCTTAKALYKKKFNKIFKRVLQSDLFR